MAKGNPNPSPSTRLGQPGGPKPGKRAGQRALEIANAEMATKIRNKLLSELFLMLEQTDGQATLAEVRGDVLKLLKDSEDRGLGAPKQDVELNANVTSMTKEQRDAAVAAAVRADS